MDRMVIHQEAGSEYECREFDFYDNVIAKQDVGTQLLWLSAQPLDAAHYFLLSVIGNLIAEETGRDDVERAQEVIRACHNQLAPAHILAEIGKLSPKKLRQLARDIETKERRSKIRVVGADR